MSDTKPVEALRAKDIPREKEPLSALETEVRALRAKTYAALTKPEKDLLQKHLFLKFGLIAPE
jgi:hypothetical protein